MNLVSIFRRRRALQTFCKRAEIGLGFQCSTNICVNNAGRKAVQIGDHCTVGANLFCASKGTIQIADHTWIGGGSSISAAAQIVIGRYCAISRDVEIRDNNSHPIDPLQRRKHLSDRQPGWNLEQWYDSDMAPILIGDDVWIGRRVLVMKGVCLGSGTVVAAGSVVTKSFPKLSVIGGNPAALIRKLDFDLPVNTEPSRFAEWFCS